MMCDNVCKHWFQIIFRIFLLLALILCPGAWFTLKALDPGKSLTQYSVRMWNKEGGLPSNSVFAIQQTQDGYLWFGTQEGLVRFDGIDFQLYTTKNIPQLKDNVIRALYEDRQGTLWIGTTSRGLTCCKQGEFTTYPVTKYRSLYKISAINEDRGSNLWIGSFTEGLTCLSKGKFTTYTTKQGLPHDQVRFISKDARGDIWVATGEGIVKVNEPGVFQDYAPGNLLPDMKTACLYEPGTGNLWIGTGKGGLTRWKNGEFTVFGVEAGVPDSIITCLYKDSLENLWIGMDGGGLTRMRKGIFSTLTGEDGLASGYVYSIYEDREGSLWVGTLDRGLHQLKDSKFTTYTTREGLAHDYIYSIHESHDDGLWIGTKQGLNRWKDGKVTAVSTAGPGILNHPVLSLEEDRRGNTWIGTMAGLHRYRDGKLITLTKADGLSDNIINCIYADRQGSAWIGTENGLNRYDGNSGTFTVFTTRQGLSSNFIGFIFADSRGNLWVGTDAGLDCIKDGVVTVFKSAAGSERDYSRCACAYEDKRGILWFGSDGGLIRLEQKETTRYTVQSGLIENYVYSILEDDSGYLWLGGRVGVSRVRKKELEDFARGKFLQVHPDCYNEKDGMKSGWCTAAGSKTRDGRFWFPTGKGVTMIDPNHIKPDPLVPVPVIEKIIVDGESVKIASTSSSSFIIHNSSLQNTPLELAPGKKRLEFYYTALSFIHPGAIRFRLKLSGYDSDWVEVGTARSTVYTGLSPGRYTFQVIACNAEGVWNRTGASFSFYLRPYFYQTGWFYFLVGLLVLLGGFSLYRIRVRQLKAREKELDALVRRRTAELEEQSGKLKEMDKIKSRFFANISHEFRTPLTLILGPLEQMLTGPQEKEREQKKKMRLMLRNSRRLLDLINQLLELSRFDSGNMKLQVARQDIVPFLKGVFHSFDSLAVQKEVELIFQTEAEGISLYYDLGKMEEVISNLLSNALKFTPPGGRISLAVEVREALSAKEGMEKQDILEVSVSDTGPGIPREALEHIFDRFYQADNTYEYHRQGTGIGLAIAREIVELHHGTITANSPGEEGWGTIFVIRLPMGGDHIKPGEMVESFPGPKRLGDPAPGVKEEGEEEEFEPVEKEEDIFKGPEALGKDIILVIEDSADVREYIRGALEPQYLVKEAGDGEEGLRQAGEIVPDIIICDIMMPGMDGYEVCRALKNEIATSHIPVILLTAKAAEENIIQGLETGADDYITKPFSTRILLARIKNLIDLRRHFQQTLNREMTLQPAKMPVTSIDKEFLKDMQKVINENLSDPEFSVDRLSRKLYMSHATLYRKIHALTGETPTDFIRSCRLKRGAELLKSSYGNVGDVAFEVGFSSTSYFIKCFKERFHRLPSSYKVSD